MTFEEGAAAHCSAEPVNCEPHTLPPRVGRGSPFVLLAQEAKLLLQLPVAYVFAVVVSSDSHGGIVRVAHGC